MLRSKKSTARNYAASHSLIAPGLSSCPILSVNFTCTFMACANNTLLIETRTQIDVDQVAASCLNKDTMASFLEDSSVQSLASMRQHISRTKKFLFL